MRSAHLVPHNLWNLELIVPTASIENLGTNSVIKRSLKGELASVTDYPPAQDYHSDSHLFHVVTSTCQGSFEISSLCVSHSDRLIL